jgi:hypothetical protein
MRLHRWLAVAILAALSGCASTWTVDSFEAPEANLAGRRSFAWTGGELGTTVAVDPAMAQSVDQHIREVVVSGLRHKGYVEAADEKSADMHVSYQVAGTRKYVTPKKPRFGAPLPDEVLTPGNPRPPLASELPREQTVRDGTVIVFVDDPASGRLIWRGMISAETRGSSTERSIHTAAEMAREIVDEFPKRSGGP